MSDVRVAAVGAEAAAEVHRLTQAAFGGYSWLTPPSGAINETEDDVRRDLAQHGGALARLDGQAVGALRMVVEPRHLHVRRVAVLPAHQGAGIGRELMAWAEDRARGLARSEVRLGVRAQLPGNREFYERLGYRVVREHHYPGTRDVLWYELAKVVTAAVRG